MRLKNLMENKQLDLNQPFLSVRRVSSMKASSKAKEKTDTPRPSLPVYKSELKSGPVRNPGTVPFLWEQIPGRPKDERKSQASNCDKKVAKYETLKEKIEKDLNSSSEDEDEAYLEAVDTLSRTESFFMNCSVTGLSGLDGADDVKRSESFLSDQQTRDFMMGRFLPAAMAMASETPQVANRKQSIQREKQKEGKKITEVDKQHQVNRHPKTFSYCAQSNLEEENEDEDNDVDVNGSDYSSSKDCGLFARFCLRGSFSLLNPVPGMRMRGPSVSSAHRFQNDNLTDNSCGHRNGKQKLEKLSLDTHLKRNDSSDNLENLKKPSRSRSLEGKVFPSGPEKVKNSKVHSEPSASGRSKFRELLANEPWAARPVVEKTLYVDSLQPSNVEGENKRTRSKSVESMDSCFLSCSGRSNYDAKLDSKASSLELDQDAMILAKAKVEDQRSINFEREQLERSGNQDRSNQEESFDNSFEDLASFTSSKASNREKFHLKSKVAKKSGNTEENSVGHNQGSFPLTSSKATVEGKINLESNSTPNIRHWSSFPPISLRFPLAPPLPKSPSESWLKRTLPTVSSKNLPSYAQRRKTSCSDPK